MAVFNHVRKEIDAKIVYYGPGISGKTTNLQQIHQRLKPDQRGKMISLATNEDRTLFFDFLPIELGSVRGFKTRFHLYTVPGQVYYGATRRAVLTGVDGVVFVADSQAGRLEDNLVSLEDLEENLRYYGKKVETVPLLMQYNKRDLPGVLSVEELNKKLNRWGAPYFESVASSGQGVFESLTSLCRMVLKAIESGAYARAADAERASSSEVEKGRLRVPVPVSTPRGSESPGLQIEKNAPELMRSVPEPSVSGPIQRPAPAVDPAKSAPQVRPKSQSESAGAGAVRKDPYISTDWEKEGGPDIRSEKRRKEEGRSILNWVFNRQNGAKTEEREEAEPSAGKGRARIISCGQPRLISAQNIEIPLELEIGDSGKTFSGQLTVSVSLERFQLKE